MRAARLLGMAVAMVAAPAAAQTTATPMRAPDGAIAPALIDTVENACIPALAGQLTWPQPGKDEDALLARLALEQGVPAEFYDKIKKVDPRLDSLSRAILANRALADGAFAMALGGADPSCRLLVYRTIDRSELAAGIETALVARGWKFVPSPPTSNPKRIFLRRVAGDRVALVRLITPAVETPIWPVLVIEVLPPGTRVPPEYGL